MIWILLILMSWCGVSQWQITLLNARIDRMNRVIDYLLNEVAAESARFIDDSREVAK